MLVGVFPSNTIQRRTLNRLPHACGGVSFFHGVGVVYVESSPCLWGCFYPILSRLLQHSVFPMLVGVFLTSFLASEHSVSLPHACGGVSLIA